MSEEKYSQLKRIERSLNNYKLSIQNNLKKLGCNEQEERFNFLYQKVSQANLSKKIKFEENQKDKFRRLFENMWINEAFVQDSINQQEPKHQYFYFVYIAFYYSLFTSLSVVVRLFEPNIREDAHKQKIEVFNKKIAEKSKFLRECYFNPFSLVIIKNEIRNLDVSTPKEINAVTVKEIDKLLSNYELRKNQTTISMNRVVNEDPNTLKVAKSLIKYAIENNKTNKADGISYVHYFMSKRHFLHYNASFIYDAYPYDLDGLLKNIKEDMTYILSVFNFLTELIFIRITKLDLIEIYEDFKSRMLHKSGISFGELYKSNLEQLKNIDERFNILKLIIGR
ncbi:hypothetical protein C4E22_02390 [ANME-1 cluster archaeon AG-394-G06]|nr:hypothetical protein [ANME-1 cluster archaeon AG-394-G06]